MDDITELIRQRNVLDRRRRAANEVIVFLQEHVEGLGVLQRGAELDIAEAARAAGMETRLAPDGSLILVDPNWDGR